MIGRTSLLAISSRSNSCLSPFFRTSGNTVTIVTTNLTPDELEQEYARCFSLLSSKQIMINVNGSDVRKNGDKQLLDLELIANKEVRPII